MSEVDALLVEVAVVIADTGAIPVEPYIFRFEWPLFSLYVYMLPLPFERQPAVLCQNL